MQGLVVAVFVHGPNDRFLVECHEDGVFEFSSSFTVGTLVSCSMRASQLRQKVIHGQLQRLAGTLLLHWTLSLASSSKLIRV